MRPRSAPLIAAGAVLVVFLVVGGILIFRSQGGGGRAVTLDVTVTGAAAMAPADLSVHQNDTVTLNVRSDRAGEVHLHGYDIHFDTKPGEVASHTFKATTTGSFEIEWESTSTHLGALAVNP